MKIVCSDFVLPQITSYDVKLLDCEDHLMHEKDLQIVAFPLGETLDLVGGSKVLTLVLRDTLSLIPSGLGFQNHVYILRNLYIMTY